MSNKKQTAVTWLWKELHPKLTFDDILLLVEKAIVMEKEQMKEMYLKGIKNYDPTFKKPMSNKKQTAVEWLKSIAYEKDLDLGHWNRAKAIEQEQIQEAFKQGYECNDVDEIFEIGETMFTAEGYYNKEYGEDTIQNTKDKMYSEEEVIKIVEISRTTGLTAEYLIERLKHKQV